MCRYCKSPATPARTFSENRSSRVSGRYRESPRDDRSAGVRFTILRSRAILCPAYSDDKPRRITRRRARSRILQRARVSRINYTRVSVPLARFLITKLSVSVALWASFYDFYCRCRNPWHRGTHDRKSTLSHGYQEFATPSPLSRAARSILRFWSRLIEKSNLSSI